MQLMLRIRNKLTQTKDKAIESKAKRKQKMKLSDLTLVPNKIKYLMFPSNRNSSPLQKKKIKSINNRK